MANLDREVMHKRNPHNFPMDLTAGEATTVTVVAPSIIG